MIKGTAHGTDANTADHFGFIAAQIGAFKSGAGQLALTSGSGNDLGGFSVGSSGDLRVREV